MMRSRDLGRRAVDPPGDLPAKRRYQKNRFDHPEHTDVRFRSHDGCRIGTLRLKPNQVSWQAKNAQKWSSVELDNLIQFIVAHGKTISH